jgi:nicotinic acid phosphoribosyltransferase
LCDTLQLNEEQGFPTDILNYKKHFENPINIKEVENKIFDFKNKPAIRLYQAPPVRNFLVQNID